MEDNDIYDLLLVPDNTSRRLVLVEVINPVAIILFFLYLTTVNGYHASVIIHPQSIPDLCYLNRNCASHP
jgi:hypothetical protein